MSTLQNYRIERLAEHNRKAFSSGEPTIDSWFVNMASQHMRNGLSVVYVLVEGQSGTIAGFYSLGNLSVIGSDLPNMGGRSLPQRMQVPMHLLGKLGVQKEYQGQGIGKMLVAEALMTAEELSQRSGSMGVVVDALRSELVPWYQKLGFIPFPSDPLRLVMTMASIRALAPRSNQK